MTGPAVDPTAELERAIGAYLAATDQDGEGSDVVVRWLLVVAGAPLDGTARAVTVTGSPDMSSYEELGLMEYVSTLTRAHIAREV